MAAPRLQLFAVECRPPGQAQAYTFFVPAQSPPEAISQAMTSAREARAQCAEVSDPFQDHAELEVRVGTFTAEQPIEIEFGDWAPLGQ
jgi:hypothetical protein